MSALATIQIDPTPAAVKALCASGSFHAHPDGKWRYSPHGGATVYCNDPSDRFALREGEIAADPETCLYAIHYQDGTRGVWEWDRNREAVLWQLYGPRHDRERKEREFLVRVMP